MAVESNVSVTSESIQFGRFIIPIRHVATLNIAGKDKEVTLFCQHSMGIMGYSILSFQCTSMKEMKTLIEGVIKCTSAYFTSIQYKKQIVGSKKNSQAIIDLYFHCPSECANFKQFLVPVLFKNFKIATKSNRKELSLTSDEGSYQEISREVNQALARLEMHTKGRLIAEEEKENRCLENIPYYLFTLRDAYKANFLRFEKIPISKNEEICTMQRLFPKFIKSYKKTVKKLGPSLQNAQNLTKMINDLENSIQRGLNDELEVEICLNLFSSVATMISKK